jgi:catechol-2,3-dioxygenase
MQWMRALEEGLLIDPIGIKVRDLEASKRFYQAALAPDGNTIEAPCHRG